MLAFGHAGVTIGTALAAQLLLNRRPDAGANIKPATPGNALASFIKDMDMRVLLAGSLLPDIIDKPLGFVVLGDSIGYGRIYAHTLLVLIAVLFTGALIYRLLAQKWLLVLTLGTFGHFVLDEMWRTPSILFWPLYGAAFPREGLADYLQILGNNIMTQPVIQASEAAGFVLLTFAGILVLKKKNGPRDFIRKGRIF